MYIHCNVGNDSVFRRTDSFFFFFAIFFSIIVAICLSPEYRYTVDTALLLAKF